MTTYKSEALEAVFENARANVEIGAISEERFREYERACLVREIPPEREALPKHRVAHPA